VWCIVVSWQQAVAVQVKLVLQQDTVHQKGVTHAPIRVLSSGNQNQRGPGVAFARTGSIPLDCGSRDRSSASCIPGSASAQMTNTRQYYSGVQRQCFEVSDMSTADGALIVQNSCTGAENQQWTLRPIWTATS
jgi:hypothetical protein